MNPPAQTEKASQVADLGLSRLEKLAPRPSTLEATGLSESFLTDLVAKHLLDGGVLDLARMVERLALAGPIIESILNFMRKEALIEVRGRSTDGSAGNLRYALTDRGRSSALDAMLRSGYVGPAPVPLELYNSIARAQTIHKRDVTQTDMDTAFQGIVLRDDLRDQLGPALNSGRAIFIYGHAGTGKTFITQKLTRLFPDMTLVPYAISVNETVVEVFDPVLHRPVDTGIEGPSLMLGIGPDPRFVCCDRPEVISGGELTADMLEVYYNHDTKQYQAPLQLKANNGVFIIDDMGRQRISPEEVFNRWIVPMEEKRDYLTLGAGRHFSVPFDVVLVFSTNLHPMDIADEAFLRRIGYKIEFTPLEVREYHAIWQQFCEQNSITCAPDTFEYTVKYLHAHHKVPMLPCHPRDLLSMAADHAAYEGQSRHVTAEGMRWAWKNYFVLSEPGTDARTTPSHGGR